MARPTLVRACPGPGTSAACMNTAASITFLTPTAALVGLAAAAPLVAITLVARRDRRLRRALGLPGEWRLLRVREGIAVVALFTLLAGAASQPVFSSVRSIDARGDVEAYVLFDVSRSMLAAAGPDEPTRFDRAIQFSLALRPRFADVPVGVASLTDRPLPHVFPTADAGTFASVVTASVGIEKPPPLERGQTRATTFEALEGLASKTSSRPARQSESSSFSPTGRAGHSTRDRLRRSSLPRRSSCTWCASGTKMSVSGRNPDRQSDIGPTRPRKRS